MSGSLDAAYSGMIEQQRNIELIANNLANVNTTAYKRVKIHFEDLLDAAKLAAAARGELPAGEAPASALGVATTGFTRDFEQGSLTPTGNPLDFAISGDGFFRVQYGDGEFAYTRDGTFRLGVDGRLSTSGGYVVDPPVSLPLTWDDMKVDAQGTISVRRPLTEAEIAGLKPGDPRDGRRETVGTVALVRFPNPAGLTSIGQNLFAESPASQAPIEGVPGVDGLGTVYSGWLEAANVDVAEEMTNLTFANRGYQLNVTTYQTIQDMLRRAGELA
jgi:flagellar basal-body rod protein FlgG